VGWRRHDGFHLGILAAGRGRSGKNAILKEVFPPGDLLYNGVSTGISSADGSFTTRRLPGSLMPKTARRVIRDSGRKSAVVECPRCHQRVIPSRPNVCPSCLQSIEVKKGEIHPNLGKHTSTSPITLFAPRQVFYLSFFTGWPTGLVLASINWVRMGSTGTAVVHWVAGSILLTLWSYVLNESKLSCGTWLGLAIHCGFCFYLYQQMKRDIKSFNLEGNQTQIAKWKSGCLLGLVTLLLFFIVVVLLSLLLLTMSQSQ
jgi:hypothetical protein